VLANQDANGYYISRYDAPTFGKLSKNLQQLSPLERLHTLWQISFLVSSGVEQPSRLLATIREFGEPSTIPDLRAILDAARPLDRYENTPEASKLLTTEVFARLGAAGQRFG
jgi:hypothetical protein